MRLLRFRAWLALGLLCVASACSSDANIKTTGSGGSGGSTGALVGCLDQPGALDRPPNGQLPCELIPPGLKL